MTLQFRTMNLKTVVYEPATTFIEAVGMFGGIVGLWLGASLISLIQLLYYFSIAIFGKMKIKPSAENIEVEPNSTPGS